MAVTCLQRFEPLCDHHHYTEPQQALGRVFTIGKRGPPKLHRSPAVARAHRTFGQRVLGADRRRAGDHKTSLWPHTGVKRSLAA